MFSKTPETFNAVDMIFSPFVDHAFRVIDGMVLAEPFERIIAPKSVGIVDRALSRLPADHGHEVVSGNSLDHSCVNPAVALQEAEDDTFSGGASSSFALALAAEIRLIHLNFPREFRPLKLRNMVESEAQPLVNPGDCLVVQPEVACQPVGRLLLVESGNDADLRADHFQAFLPDTISAFHVSAGSPVDFERPAEYALFSAQKVGRATENVLSCVTHKDILMPYGYETH